MAAISASLAWIPAEVESAAPRAGSLEAVETATAILHEARQPTHTDADPTVALV